VHLARKQIEVVRFDSEAGQTMSEYALTLTLIVLVTVTVFLTLSDSVSNAIKSVAGLFP
jgi:Flp pilus assembly pilin Flp